MSVIPGLSTAAHAQSPPPVPAATVNGTSLERGAPYVDVLARAPRRSLKGDSPLVPTTLASPRFAAAATRANAAAPVELEMMSRYAGWGMAIGGVGGFLYGITSDRDASRHFLGVPLLVDTAAGMAIGVVGGVVTYIVRMATKS